jgi:hypothetical protein
MALEKELMRRMEANQAEIDRAEHALDEYVVRNAEPGQPTIYHSPESPTNVAAARRHLEELKTERKRLTDEYAAELKRSRGAHR